MNSEFLVDGLYLLVHHLLRSHSLRQILRKKDHKLFKILEDLGEDETYA